MKHDFLGESLNKSLNTMEKKHKKQMKRVTSNQKKYLHNLDKLDRKVSHG
jgi:hypothetical protein